jgi:hypothetical protein
MRLDRSKSELKLEVIRVSAWFTALGSEILTIQFELRL